ncbi:MAG: hypothetical protein B7Y90_10700 [Alphaproteobacteria bacterium 32-64-14]|nr:MAG: hypothetical protein B7Y90_10700 [Alphaproteobacteria bacterium 32-64-14]
MRVSGMTIVGVTHMAGERLILSLSKDAGAGCEVVSTASCFRLRCASARRVDRLSMRPVSGVMVSL